jgi:hypothetical protein
VERRGSVNGPSPGRSISLARRKPDLNAAIAELYRLPRDEFTGARNDLVKRLRGDGKRAEAEQVKALAKPTASAWIVNQLGRQAGADLKKLLSAGDRMRKARTATELREASGAEREAITRLLARVEEVAGPQPAATTERVRETLHAAAGDPDVGALVSAGCLTREQRLVGFGGAALTPDRAAEPPPARDDQRRRRREREAAAREREQAERAHQRAVADAQRAQAELERAEKRLHEATEREQELAG